jgi:hypothetical protein
MQGVCSVLRVGVVIIGLIVAGATDVGAQIPQIVSDGSLGAVAWWDAAYLNTDAMTIDYYSSFSGYVVGAFWPPGMYTGPGDTDGCARLVSQPGGPDIVVFDFTDAVISVPVAVRGNRPAAIAATGPIVINGAVYVQNGYAGAGSPVTCPGAPGCGAGIAGSGPGGAAAAPALESTWRSAVSLTLLRAAAGAAGEALLPEPRGATAERCMMSPGSTGCSLEARPALPTWLLSVHSCQGVAEAQGAIARCGADPLRMAAPAAAV